ncbi:hypothetical protein NW863_04280 [Synechococcus sp. B60.1]
MAKAFGGVNSKFSGDAGTGKRVFGSVSIQRPPKTNNLCRTPKFSG